MNDPEQTEPGLPEFDFRRTRWAVRRGIAKSAGTAVLWLFLLAIVLDMGSAFIQARGDRRQHFNDVVGIGYLVANPHLSASRWSCCNSSIGRTTLLNEFEMRGGGSERDVLPAEIQQTFWGNVVRESLPPPTSFAIDKAFEGPPIRGSKSLLSSLPAPTLVTAVVGFVEGFEQVRLDQFVERNLFVGFEQPIFLQSLYDGQNRDQQIPLAWQRPRIDQFQRWAGRLRDSDNDNLATIGLPSAEEIDDVAQEGLAYGILVEDLTPARLQRLLHDADVRSVNVFRVGFDVDSG